MNDTTTDDAPIPFPTKEERDELILEFQRLAARLTRAGLLSRASSSRPPRRRPTRAACAWSCGGDGQALRATGVVTA